MGRVVPLATARGIGFQPVCEKPCVWGRWTSSCRWEAGITLKGSTNWKFVATARGIGFQPVESKPIPLAQNPPPTQDLPRRGYFSQPGVAASAATPGKIPPRSPLPCKGCVRFGAWKIVGFTCLSPGERSNPYRIESALFGGFTWGSRRCGNPRLRKVSPLGNFSDVASNTSCWVVVIGLGTRFDWHEQIFKFVLRTDAGPRRADGRPG